MLVLLLLVDIICCSCGPIWMNMLAALMCDYVYQHITIKLFILLNPIVLLLKTVEFTTILLFYRTLR